MKHKVRRPWILLLAAGVLMLAALILLLATAPSPTVLSVQIVDAETGDPLPGSHVWVRGRSGESLPTATTDERGLVHLEDLPPDPAYLIRVQKIDYDVTFEPSVAVTEGKVTEVTVAISPQAGGRLFVGLDQARVVEVDTASLLVVRTLHLPDWENGATRHVRVHPSEDLLYAVTAAEGSILDGQSGTVLERFEVDGIIEILSLDDAVLTMFADMEGGVEESGTEGSSVHVVEYGESGQLLALDAHTGALLYSKKADNPLTSPLLFWRTDGEVLNVIEPATGSLWRLALRPIEALIYIATGAYPKEGFLSADGHYRYVWSEDSFDKLKAVFGGDLTPVSGNQLSVASTSALSLSPTGQELYVLNAEFGTLSIVDLTGDEPPTLVAVGKRPVALVVSPGGMWAYVANRESKTISVVHLPSLRVVQTIPVDGEPLSLAIR